MNYYIQGSSARAKEIKEAFEKLGYNSAVNGWNFNADCGVYFTNEADKSVDYTHIETFVNLIKTHPDYKELELPKPHYDIKNFHAGMPVLVRDAKGEEWRYGEFSHLSSRFGDNQFCAGCTYWVQCIPFEGNEHLVGTTDMCDERFVNW